MFGWAGAAAGAQQATDDAKKLEMDLQTQLAEREYRRQVIQMQQAQEDRLRQQMAQADRQFTVQQDNLATDRRQAENERGVQTMVGELIRREGITPQNRGQIIGTLVEAGRMPTQADLAPPVDPQAELREYEAKKQIDAKYARPPQGPAPDYEWVVRGGQPMQIRKGTAQPGDRPYDAVAARSGGAGTDGRVSKYALETASRTIKSIDDVLPDINGLTAGWAGSVLSNVPGTAAANVSAELSSVASNIAFNALQAMRDASKTGGALGQVSERELDLLSAVEGSIRQNQSPANLKAQLAKVRASMERVQQAAQSEMQTGGVPINTDPMSAAPAAVQKWGRDANGRPIRIQ